jgi:hypothetical protein
VRVFTAIAVVSSVGAVEEAQIGSRAVGGDCALPEPGDGCNVVGAVGDGAFPDVIEAAYNVVLDDGCGLLEVVDGDVSRRVLGCEYPGLDVAWELVTP